MSTQIESIPYLSEEKQRALDEKIAAALESILVEFQDAPLGIVEGAIFLGARDFIVKHDSDPERIWAMLAKSQVEFCEPGWSKERLAELRNKTNGNEHA